MEKPPSFWNGYVSTVALSYAEFELRLGRVTTWPYLLVLFVESGPHVECPVRRRACNQLVDAHNRQLDHSTAKLRCIFWRHLLRTAVFGTLFVDLHKILEEWKADLPADIQLVESKNSVLSRIPALSPNIGDALVASRFTIKCDLIANHSANPKRCVSRALQYAIGNYKGSTYQAINGNEGRFSSTLEDDMSFFPVCPGNH